MRLTSNWVFSEPHGQVSKPKKVMTRYYRLTSKRQLRCLITRNSMFQKQRDQKPSGWNEPHLQLPLLHPPPFRDPASVTTSIAGMTPVEILSYLLILVHGGVSWELPSFSSVIRPLGGRSPAVVRMGRCRQLLPQFGKLSERQKRGEA